MRGATLAATLAIVPLTAACGGGDGDADPRRKQARVSVSDAPANGVVAPAKVEVIAGLTGCKPKIRIDATELRQGLCHTKEVDYLITTFPTDELKETWLDSASGYGGEYLVGTRWIVSAQPQMLDGFRDKLGGTIRQLRGFGPAAEPSAS
ncbi:MAG: hypothetical protein JF597_18560 [Streptomyces sp.]|uniref:hypothetical protein n=1 Tax=Streptomyces sp. TaxID=1931 RepID=UPI0025D0D4F3|nr:hypothetical protein [Streptomyces sp.]MBW8795519.1 hypothetical protein [Streptomyces sp.]